MKNSDFMTQKLEEKRAKLLNTLRKKFCLDKEELIAILNSVDYSKQYSLIYCKSKTDFLGHCKLKDLRWEEELERGTWSEGTIDSSIKVFGDYKFGLVRSRNGETTDEFEPELLTNRACAIINTTNWGFDDPKIPSNRNQIVVFIQKEATA